MKPDVGCRVDSSGFGLSLESRALSLASEEGRSSANKEAEAREGQKHNIGA